MQDTANVEPIDVPSSQEEMNIFGFMDIVPAIPCADIGTVEEEIQDYLAVQ